ncbi:hypothetical protein C6P46_003079 [Rhodotorula mucilaginosa]|uniref:Uncharacterized protein n=1 Tax=Rhodotorula mucilaginosa TaxID=5537 RepID=A0A9P6W518_RHOMI|nr:hypothetical protein C6P46_003079 [Rhodotorula mucilaginosa]
MKFSLAAVVAAIAFSASAQAQEVPSEIAALSSQFSGILNGGGLPTGAALQSDIGVLTSALANPTVSSYGKPTHFPPVFPAIAASFLTSFPHSRAVFNNPSLSALAQGALALAGANGGASSGASSAASATSSGSAASATSMASSAASGASSGASSVASGASSAIAGATSAAGSAAAGASSAAASAAPKSGAESLRGAFAPVAVALGVVAGAVAVL